MKITLTYKRVALNRDRIIHKYLGLRKKYGKYVLCKNETFLTIFFSIMIMENYNRPWFLRILEYIFFVFKKIIYKEAFMTLGIMQIRTNVLIGNIKSIRLAEEYMQEEIIKHHFSNNEEMINCIALKYNPSQLYREEIFKIYNCITSSKNWKR